MIMNCLPGRAVRALEAGARLRSEREGLHPEPDDERVVRARLDRAELGPERLAAGGRQMLRFVVRRLLLLVPILLGLSILVFLWIRALPGSPAKALLGERATPEPIARSTQQYGLDSPIYEQYWRYLKTIVQLRLSAQRSRRRRPVVDEFKRAVPGDGRARARGDALRDRRSASRSASSPRSGTGSWFDHASLVASLIGISIPIFFLALILKYIFAVQARLAADASAAIDVLDRRRAPDELLHPRRDHRAATWARSGTSIKHLILPAIALGSIPLAIIARITRASVLDVQNEDYVRTARAKGLPPRHRRPAARAAERDAAGHDDHRPADRAAALGRRADRDGLRLARASALARATRSSTATTRCSRAGSCSSRSSSCSSTWSWTSRTRSSTRGSGCS